MGMRQFVARFLTLPKPQFIHGIKELCTKFELQLQCQNGFGDSRFRQLKKNYHSPRADIQRRVEQMIKNNGNLKILLEEQCKHENFDPTPYYCISDDPSIWSKPCFKAVVFLLSRINLAGNATIQLYSILGRSSNS